MVNTVLPTHIGLVAYENLSQAQGGKVLGVTSRGVFVQLLPGGIVFLSAETYRGPLTLNIAAADIPLLRHLQPGTGIAICPSRLSFPDAGLEVAFSAANTWDGQLVGLLLQPLAERRAAALETARQVQHRQADPERGGLLAVAQAILKSSCQAQAAPYKLEPLLQALHERSATAAAAALEPLLGLGPGLTPAGDDLATGLLLAANRWQAALEPGWNIHELNHLVLGCAARHTTTLSTALLNCAARGLADERLLQALDGIMTGTPAPIPSAVSLVNYGSSSGGDALAGMVLLLCGG